MNIRTAPVAVLSIDELITANAYLGVLADRIHENGHDVPSVVRDEQKAIQRELTERLRDDKERQLKVLESRREALLTVPERRKKVEDEIAKLRDELGESNGTGKRKAAVARK